MTPIAKKSSKIIVYIREFDKYDHLGKMLCRNTQCSSYPRAPYRKYCSKKCSSTFRRWYYHNFYWDRVRSDVFKRDDYTCQICKKKYAYRYRKFVRSKNLQCDHIVPRSLGSKHGYTFDTFENRMRAVLEFLHNRNNLRTVCQTCHKRLTSEYLSKRRLIHSEKLDRINFERLTKNYAKSVTHT
jgi:5-methylcytosine-specific restriction endonuclease McrA